MITVETVIKKRQTDIIKAKKIKSDNFSGSNREKFNIAIAMFGIINNWIHCKNSFGKDSNYLSL